MLPRMKNGTGFVAAEPAEYGLTARQIIGRRLRDAKRRFQPRLVTLTCKITAIDDEFLSSGAIAQGISKSEFIRRIFFAERLNWQRNGLFQPSAKQ